MSKTAIIVQARMASTRLSGKAILPLAGKTVLAHVLARCARVPGIEVVCCAVPKGTINDAVAAEAEKRGAVVYRGSEEDVLDRYWQAARMLKADIVMRVTSDCPLADPELCGEVLRHVSEGGADYACNNMPASWPHGLDCEAFKFAALDRSAHEATRPLEREHVTPWLRNNPNLKKANVAGPGGWVAEQRWTLDFPEDYEFFKAVFAALPVAPENATTDAILNLLRARPDIVALNAMHHNVSRPNERALPLEQ